MPENRCLLLPCGVGVRQPPGARMSSSTSASSPNPTYQDFDGGINYQLHFQPLSLLWGSGRKWDMGGLKMSGF